MNIEEKAYVVRQGFTLHKGDAIFHAGEIVSLTEAQAHDRRHQIEPAPNQDEPAARNPETVPEKPAASSKKKLFARN